MQDQNIKCTQSTQLQAAVMKSARGVTVALRYTSGIIPAHLLDAVIAAGRASYETLSAISVDGIISDATTIRMDIQAELDRLDEELAVALASDD